MMYQFRRTKEWRLSYFLFFPILIFNVCVSLLLGFFRSLQTLSRGHISLSVIHIPE